MYKIKKKYIVTGLKGNESSFYNTWQPVLAHWPINMLDKKGATVAQ